jgi:adenosine deaminase
MDGILTHNSEENWEKVSSLRAQLHALPKIDLHRHLEGSLRLQTLAEIAQEHGIDLPSYDIEYLRPFVTAANDEPDFHRFLEKFRLLRRFYPTQAAVERVAYEAVADAAADNIKYLELRFNPVALARVQGFSYDQVTTWVCNAVTRAQLEYDVCANLILQINRDEDIETASRIVEVAFTHRDNGIVGLDLAGDEKEYPSLRGFAEICQRARSDGLYVTVHAGEAGSSANVREAIELLGAQRIGHGIRTIENSHVVHLVQERGVTLEVCPTSNLQTGAVRRFGQHPLTDLLALNLRVTINTDDPSVSDTTLTDEYVVAMLTMGVTLGQIKHAIVTAAEGSFQSPEDRARLADWFRQELGVRDSHSQDFSLEMNLTGVTDKRGRL